MKRSNSVLNEREFSLSENSKKNVLQKRYETISWVTVKGSFRANEMFCKEELKQPKAYSAHHILVHLATHSKQAHRLNKRQVLPQQAHR